MYHLSCRHKYSQYKIFNGRLMFVNLIFDKLYMRIIVVYVPFAELGWSQFTEILDRSMFFFYLIPDQISRHQIGHSDVTVNI